MEYSDLKLVADIAQASGYLCFVLAAIAYLYEERSLGYYVTNPYREYTFLLVVLVIVLMVISDLIRDHARKNSGGDITSP